MEITLLKPAIWLKVMRITSMQFILLLVFAGVSIAGKMDAQVLEKRVSLSLDNTEISKALRQIEKQAEVKFVYSPQVIKSGQSVNIRSKQEKLGDLLEKMLVPLGIRFEVSGKYILLNDGQKPIGYFRDDSGTELLALPERILRGKVTDEKGEGLPGVSIMVKSTQRGTISGIDGSYELSLEDADQTLIFSFVGYITQEIEIGSRNVVDVTLAPIQKSLEEVVVIGYGSQRRRDITAAVSVIDVEEIGAMPSSNMTRLLQGQAPGVVASQLSGTPGEPFQIRVRGVSSLGAGSNPLYVIDGFPVGTSVGQNINPNDIASISVLKDAAATAIYGARGSNGVILITTKSGQEGKVGLNLSMDFGVQNLPDSRKVTVLTGPEFAQFKKEVFSDRFLFDNGRLPELEEIPIGFRYPEQTKYSTNWFDAILNSNAPYTDVNLTMSSGSGAVKSLLSLGYYKEQGAIIVTDYDRLSVRSNLEGNINKFITLGVNLNGSYSKSNLANTNGRNSIVGSALLIDPREPMYDEEGNLRPYIGGNDGVFAYPNPVFALKKILRRRSIADFLSNGYAELNLAPGLKFRSSVNVRLNYNKYKEYIPSTIGQELGSGTSGAPPRIATLNESTTQLMNTATDQLLTYSKQIDENHMLDFLAGINTQREVVKGLTGTANTFPDDLVPFLGAGAIRSSSSTEYQWTILAFIGRINYAFKDKYLLSATMRREGSSRFGKNTKYGNFPAVSAGWRISEENFFPKYNWLSDLKLRGSWGITGNNDIGNYTHLAFMTNSNYILGNSLAPGKIVEAFANADLKWETSNQLDLGLDLSLLNNSLTFTAEWYKKITNDMLFNVPIPSVSGFTSVFTNLGKVQNRGLEFAADYRLKLGQANFRTNANITFNRSKILQLRGDDDTPIWTGSVYSGYHVQKIGSPIGMLYGYKKMGIFNTQEEIDAWPLQDGAIPGSMKFWDADGNGEVTYDTQDMVEIGNPNPAFTWAWTVGGDYRNFDISLLFTGAANYQIYRNIESSTMNMDGVFNVLDKAKDRWRSPENPGSNPNHKNSQGGTNFWKWGRESSERYIYDAGHTWLRNVTIGYTLYPRGKFIKDARIFLSATNLFLFTKYPGNNPEANQRNGTTEMGYDDEAYPVPRTFAGGIRVNF